MTQTRSNNPIRRGRDNTADRSQDERSRVNPTPTLSQNGIQTTAGNAVTHNVALSTANPQLPDPTHLQGMYGNAAVNRNINDSQTASHTVLPLTANLEDNVPHSSEESSSDVTDVTGSRRQEDVLRRNDNTDMVQGAEITASTKQVKVTSAHERQLHRFESELDESPITLEHEVLPILRIAPAPTLDYTRISTSFSPVRSLDLSPLYKSAEEQQIPVLRAKDAADYASGLFQSALQMISSQRDSVRDLGNDSMQRILWAYQSASNRIYGEFNRADTEVESTYTMIQDGLRISAETTDSGIIRRYAESRLLLSRASAGAKTQIKHNGDTADQQVKSILDKLSKSFHDIINAGSHSCETASATATRNLNRWIRAIPENYPITGQPQRMVENEAKSVNATKLGGQAQKEVTKRSTQVESYFTTNKTRVSTLISNRVSPALQSYANGIKTHGAKSVDRAFDSAFRNLKKQAGTARTANAEIHQQAQAGLTLQRKSERERLELESLRVNQALYQQADRALQTTQSTLEESLPMYTSNAGKMGSSLNKAAYNGPSSLRKLAENATKNVTAATDTASQLQKRQLATVFVGTEQGLVSITQDETRQDNAAVATLRYSMQDSADAWSLSMAASAASMTDSFKYVTRGVQNEATRWGVPFEQKFKKFIDDQRKELHNDLPEFERKVGVNKDRYLNWVNPHAQPSVLFASPLNEAASKAWSRVTKARTDLGKALSAGIIDTVNEEGVSDALRGLTAVQGNALRSGWRGQPDLAKDQIFKLVTGTDVYSLDSHLKFALGPDSNDYYSAINYLNGNTAEGARYELKASIHWYNDEESRIEKVMRSLTEEQRGQLQSLDGWAETEKDVRSALGGTDLDVFNALDEGNHALADAYRMRESLINARASYDKDAINAVLTQYSEGTSYAGVEIGGAERRAQVQREFSRIQGQDLDTRTQQLLSQRQAPAVTAPTTAGSAETAAPLTTVEPSGSTTPTTASTGEPATRVVTQQQTAPAAPPKPSDILTDLSLSIPAKSAEEQARDEAAGMVLFEYATQDMVRHRGSRREGDYRTETISFQGAERDLARDLIFHGDRSPEARASRLGVEVQRGRRPDVVNLDTALVDPRLNPNPNLRYDMSAQALQRLRTQALSEREEMFRIFARRYGKASNDVSVIQSQRILIQQLKEVYGEDKVGASIAELLVWEEHPSPVTAALEMHYAIEGAGTNNKLIDRVLPRMNRDEIKQMRGYYKTITGNDLYTDLGVYGHGWFGDLSGDDRLRAERQLRGRPRNDRERFEAAAYAIKQQRDETGVVGKWLASGSLQDLQLGYMQEELGALIGGDVTFGPDGEAIWTGSGDFDSEGKFSGDASNFTALTEGAQAAAENYSAKIDQYANFAATTIAIIGAIAAAVATVVTGGAASPLLMAAIAGITGLTAMGAQYMIKGGRYGWEQAATDLGMTAVQALTAGIGQKLALASRGLGSANAARQLAMRQAQGLAPQIGKSGIIIGQMGHLTGNAFVDKLLIGISSGAIGSLGQTALDEQTWDKGAESGILNLFSGMFRGALVGGVTAGVTNAIEDLPLKKIPGLGGLQRALGKETIGEAIGESTNVAGRAFGKALTSSTGAFVGRGVELEYETARGRYHGDAGDIFVAMAEAGGMSALQSVGEGAFEARAQLIHNARVARMRQQAASEGETFRRVPEPEPETTRRPGEADTQTKPEETGVPAINAAELEAAPVATTKPSLSVEAEPTPSTTRVPAAEAEPLGHAAAVAGSGFRGDIETTPRAGMVGRSMRAVEALVAEGGPLAGIARIPEGESNRVAVRVADGEEVKARLSIIEHMPTDADGTVPVARYHFDESANEYVVRLSARASPDVIERAVAHELAEISHAHGAGEVDVALRPGGLGSRPLAEGETPRLAPHDRGRLAELDVLARQIESAMQGGDELKAARLRDEVERLVTHMGLSGDSEASAIRRAVVEAELASRPAARALLDSAIDTAQNNPFLQRHSGDLAEDLDLLASQLAYARRLEDVVLAAQVLELARRRLISAGLVTADRSREVSANIERHALNQLAAQGNEARSVLLRAAEPLARSNPNLESATGTKDPAVLDPHQSEAIRQQFGDRTQFQDWPEFREKFFASRSSYDAANPEHLAIAFSRWTSGDYVGPEGALRSITAATRRPDPGFERRWAQVPAEFPGATPEAATKLPSGVTVADAVENRRTLIEERAALAREMIQPDTLPARLAEIDAKVRKLSSQINGLSEALGEAAGRKYAGEQPGGLKEIPLPRSGANLPDLVFESESGRLLVIEAKGGESELGVRRNADRTRMVQQGTREYLDSLARTMMSSPDDEISKLGHRILTELNKTPPNIDYVVVRQPFTDDNRLSAPIVGTFDVSDNKQTAATAKPASTRVLASTPESAQASRQTAVAIEQNPESLPLQQRPLEEKMNLLRQMLEQNDTENFRSLLGSVAEEMGINREQLIKTLFMPVEIGENWDVETGLSSGQKRELKVERYQMEQLRKKELGRKVTQARASQSKAQETERVLGDIAAELQLDREQLIHRIFNDMVDWIVSDQTVTGESGFKGRRPNTKALTDILRGRMRAAGIDFEGFVLDSVLAENIDAIRSISARISDVSPDAILTVERGGVFLADAITQQDEGLMHITHRLPKGEKGERTPHMEQRIRQLIAEGKKNFVLLDFYMGGGASKEFMNMYRQILQDHPEVRFESIWLREARGFERNTENGLSLEVFKDTPEDLKHAVNQTVVTTGFVLGDDMNIVFDPNSRRPITIFDRKGNVVRQISVGTPDPVTGRPLNNTREILLLLLEGVEFPA